MFSPWRWDLVMVPFRATLFSEMKYSFIGGDSLRGSLTEIWIHGSSRHFLQYLMGHQSSVCITLCTSSKYTPPPPPPTSLLALRPLLFTFRQIRPENVDPGTSRIMSICLFVFLSLFVFFFAVFLARPLFWLPSCDSVFFLNRLTSLKVQSFVRNHQSVHTKSAWLHASEEIKGSEVGTVIQRERVVCSQAYHFIPSCIFTSKPLSMQISLVWTVDPPITSYFCFSSFLPP